jgi:hypothetical protein
MVVCSSVWTVRTGRKISTKSRHYFSGNPPVKRPRDVREVVTGPDQLRKTPWGGRVICTPVAAEKAEREHSERESCNVNGEEQCAETGQHLTDSSDDDVRVIFHSNQPTGQSPAALILRE